MTGTFNPTYSTNDIWRDEEFDHCLTLDLDAIEADIDTLQSSKANTNHTHSGYATYDHTHTGYAESNHTHTEYAAVTHEHDGYALASHAHAEYAAVNHVHDGYASATHTHNDYAAINHAHSYNDLTDKPTIPSTDGLATTAYVDSAVAGVSSITVDSALSATSTNPVQNKIVYEGLNTLSTGLANHTHGDLYYTESEVDTLLNAKANASHIHNVFSSLTEIGITSFPTTMKLVSEAMPKNSMIVIDTRRVNGVESDYNTETISDWANEANGTAIITKGVSTARIGMMIMYCTTQTSVARIYYGSYAHDADRVNWADLDGLLDDKIDKISKYAAVDLNTLTESGLYYVSDETTALHCPAGSNGHILVMSDGTRVRQVFFRVGTVNTNNFQWYSRSLGSDTTVGDNGWSEWWLLSGTEKVWNGGTVLNSEINIGSRYGCQSWIVVARLQNTGAMASVVIPRAFLTNDTDLYRFQIADETAFISFYIYYKSDNDVYLKVIDQTDSEYTTLKYVYRMS